MPDDVRRSGHREERSADEAALSARLARLGVELGRHEPSRPAEPSRDAPPAADPSAIARGFRLSSELVAAVLLGAGIGWLLDRWLGISPWGLIVYLLLGFAAGVLNVMRAAGVVAPNRMDRSDKER
jgi:ATP synthase protein I